MIYMVRRRKSRSRSSGRGRTIHTVNYQRGKSNTRKDAKRHALTPGRRRSRSGRKYNETRKNRSDKRGSRI